MGECNLRQTDGGKEPLRLMMKQAKTHHCTNTHLNTLWASMHHRAHAHNPAEAVFD